MTQHVSKMSKPVSGKDVTQKKDKLPLAPQSMGMLTAGLLLALTAWALMQEASRDAAARMTLMTGVYVLAASYIYCDYWLWMLHCFLDRKENLASVNPEIKRLAESFQDHHDVPAKVLTENHLGEIDNLVSGVAGAGLLLGYWTSPATKLILVGICLWGSMGSLNHFYGHALTHSYEVPAFFKYGQAWGLLPTSKHHKTHHTAPFEMNWNFLNGFYKLYESLYFATGSSYAGLFAMFYSCNPVVMQTWGLALGILA